MFRYCYLVQFNDIDAAGILYFPTYLHLCHMAFEAAFNQAGPTNYSTLINQHRLGFPAVHLESSFKSPVAHGDELKIELSTNKIGCSSVISDYRFYKNKDVAPCFLAKITTVCIDLDKKVKKPVPDDLRAFLMELNKMHEDPRDP
jgi:YbgC/YbaW family acyl-CoA thioester hydrolase